MVASKWIYKIKHVVDGSVKKYKPISVARRFSQTEGVFYDETVDIEAELLDTSKI
jgi:hypothetical protein